MEQRLKIIIKPRSELVQLKFAAREKRGLDIDIPYESNTPGNSMFEF
jgi:hypothetical protein